MQVAPAGLREMASMLPIALDVVGNVGNILTELQNISSCQDALDIVMAALQKHANEPDLAEKAGQELIKCAMRQWKIHEQGYRDDITATVVLLDVFRQAAP